MAAKILVLYQQPSDTDGFDKYYFENHAPLARKIPPLRSMKFHAGPPVAMAGTAAHLVAELEFDTMADLQAGMASPEGQAAVAGLQNLAQDPTVLVDETRLDG
jgi:uncharacterized protein (TIGR02118 family)